MPSIENRTDSIPRQLPPLLMITDADAMICCRLARVSRYDADFFALLMLLDAREIREGETSSA